MDRSRRIAQGKIKLFKLCGRDQPKYETITDTSNVFDLKHRQNIQNWAQKKCPSRNIMQRRVMTRTADPSKRPEEVKMKPTLTKNSNQEATFAEEMN